MEEPVVVSSSEVAALVKRSVAEAETRLRAEFEVALNSRVDELQLQLADQESMISQLLDSNAEMYETSSQAVRRLVADLTARDAEQEQQRRRVKARANLLEQRLSDQAEELEAWKSSQHSGKAGTDTGGEFEADLDRMRQRLAAVEGLAQIYKTSSQAMRTLAADLTAEQEQQRRRVEARAHILEQRLSDQEEALEAWKSSHHSGKAGTDTGGHFEADLDRVRQRLAAVEAHVEQRTADTGKAQVRPPASSITAADASQSRPTMLPGATAVQAAVAAKPLDAGLSELSEHPSAQTQRADQRHQHSPMDQSPRLQLRNPDEPPTGVNLALVADYDDGVETDASCQLAVATEKVEVATTAAAVLFDEVAAEADTSAERLAVKAASGAIKREMDELATLVVSLITGCRTEIKRLADAFFVMSSRRQTSDQVIRSLAEKLQAMQKQEATESLASTRRIGALCGAIKLLAMEVDSGFENVAQQLSQVSCCSRSADGSEVLMHHVGSAQRIQSSGVGLMKSANAFAKVERLLPPGDY